jgi:hypothetical protein
LGIKELQKQDVKLPAEMPANCYRETTRRNKWLTVPLPINSVEVFRRKFIAVKKRHSYETKIPALSSRE